MAMLSYAATLIPLFDADAATRRRFARFRRNGRRHTACAVQAFATMSSVAMPPALRHALMLLLLRHTISDY